MTTRDDGEPCRYGRPVLGSRCTTAATPPWWSATTIDSPTPTPKRALAGRRPGSARAGARAAAPTSASSSRPGVDFVVAWLAVTRIGAVAVPISTFSTADELRGLLADADIDVLLAIDGYRGHDYVARLRGGGRRRPVAPGGVPPARGAVRSATCSWPGRRTASHPSTPSTRSVTRATSVDDAHFDAIEADVSPDDRMVIVYTSGSTSAPKGVIHQHGPLIRHVGNLNELRGLAAGVKLFSNSPLFWIGGLGVQRRRHARRRFDARVLDQPRRWRDPRPHRTRAPRARQRLRRSRSPTS